MRTAVIALFVALLQCVSAFAVGGIAHTRVQPAISMKVVEKTGPLSWAKGRVVATKNIFARSDKKKKQSEEVDMSLTPFVNLAGALLGAGATAAASALDAAVNLDEA